MHDIISEITFIKKQKTKPYYHSSAITGMIPKLYFKTESRNVHIKNARKIKKFNLDTHGFALYEHKFKYDSIEKNNIDKYKKELIKFLKKIITFEYANIFDLTRRSNLKTGAYNSDGFRQPAERAHVDYTKKSGPIRAKNILGEDIYNNARKSNKRIIQINIWRPISKVVLSSPLAIADAGTIDSKDLIATDQYFPDRIGEIYHLAYNPNQSWYWVSEMNNNELLIFKGWDSTESEKISKFTPHTSFNLHNQNIDKFPRESIEARIFLIL